MTKKKFKDEKSVDCEQEQSLEPVVSRVPGQLSDGEGHSDNRDQFDWIGENKIHRMTIAYDSSNQQRAVSPGHTWRLASDRDVHHHPIRSSVRNIQRKVICGVSNKRKNNDAEKDGVRCSDSAVWAQRAVKQFRIDCHPRLLRCNSTPSAFLQRSTPRVSSSPSSIANTYFVVSEGVNHVCKINKGETMETPTSEVLIERAHVVVGPSIPRSGVVEDRRQKQRIPERSKDSEQPRVFLF